MFWHLSLKKKLVCLFSIVVFSLMLGSTYSIYVMKKSGENSVMKTFENYAQSLQSSIAAQFFERYGDVQAFALNPVMLSMDRAEIVPFLNQYVALYGIYDLILVVDTGGNLIAVNSLNPKGEPLAVDQLYRNNYSSQEWFENTLKGKFSEDKDMGFVGTFVEDVHFDEIVENVTKQKSFGNSFNAQIKTEKGQVVGVISNRAGARWWDGEFVNLYKSLKRSGIDKTELTLLDKQGNIITDFDPGKTGDENQISYDPQVIQKLNLVDLGVSAAKEATQGKTGSNISKHARKKIDQISGYSGISDKKFLQSLGWSVLVRNVSANAFATLNKTWNQYWGIAVVMFLLALGVMFVFSTRLTQRLDTVSNSLLSSGIEASNASNQLSAMSQVLSAGSTESSASLETTMSAMEELSSMVLRNNQSAKEASSLAQQGTEKAIQGQNETAKLDAAVKDISNSSKKIEEIITVIDDIAFQTNLLALNASVEAARAGEHGRGFAVVASAVRTLAQRSSEAAKDISVMIKDSVSKVQLGLVASQNSSKCLTEIVDCINKVNQLNREIVVASDEQARGLDQINKSLNELTETTQKNASTAEETAATAEELSSQSYELENISRVLKKEVSGNEGFEKSPRPEMNPSGSASNNTIPFKGRV